MTMTKVVLDTNVLVSALLKSNSSPSIILSLILDGKVKLCLSREIFSEYQGVLARKKFQQLDQKFVKDILSKLDQISVLVEPKVKIDLALDKDDNKFIECAIEAQANFIITGNTKHFPKKYQNIDIVTPKEFILKLF